MQSVSQTLDLAVVLSVGIGQWIAVAQRKGGRFIAVVAAEGNFPPAGCGADFMVFGCRWNVVGEHQRDRDGLTVI